MKSITVQNIPFFLLGFLGISAIGGGGALIISPSGKLFGMPLSMLMNSPFQNFLIPGIVLFVVLGIPSILTAVALKKIRPNKMADKLNMFGYMHWAWTFSIYIAFALIIWLQAEMYFLQAVHWLHCLYMAIAIAIILAALLPTVRKQYIK
ncbi:MAG: hypothetical protein H7Y86_09630 [Rhizobacter sp.]|nr:hypothetical protein [Ferruginibacter sp.]